MQLHETNTGRRFFESQLPNLIRQLTRIADALEAQNELKKMELNQKGESDYDNRG